MKPAEATAFRYLILARSDVHDVWDQPPAIEYRNAKGALKRHTFDYLVTLTCGKKPAVAVKPSARADRMRFRDELALIQASAPTGFADEVVLVTERQFTRLLPPMPPACMSFAASQILMPTISYGN